jgi:hypothetical protein
MLDSMTTVIGTAVLGIAGWAVRLESRISGQDIRHQDLKELIETKFKGADDKIDAKFAGMDARLQRIEQALNGKLR